ncbi:MAG: serine/threonine protein kinase [Gemmatimonadetes bacterium]|nr:serine/threonine protein kinase [Gemmatimonadota bacterium]NNM33998.1 serine/threonine protein kinase [Gemmatimonadota bacterium]
MTCHGPSDVVSCWGMETDRWVRIQTLTESAKALPHAERGAFLDEACDDAELRTLIAEMLEAGESGALGLEAKLLTSDPADLGKEDGPEPAVSVESGLSIGSYEVGRRLGRGGMADVYLAYERADPDRHPVALKLLRFGKGGADRLPRFQRELEILSRLDHPAIATVLDSGTAADGRPFMVMHYVEGHTLLDFVVQRRSTAAERLQLFVSVCQTVQFAHDRGVIHRDLKLSNVLVREDGTPVLLDFGIGKLMRTFASEPPAGFVTPAGVRLLTPANAAPEQVSGQPQTVQTDVYGLGLILYELVAGRPALDPKGVNWLEWERRVLEVEPAAPSSVPAAPIRMEPGLRPRTLDELDGIVLKALRKEPAERHQSARALADAVARCLSELSPA